MKDNPEVQPERRSKVILIRNAYDFDMGGAEKYPIILGQQLEKHGYEPIIVSGHSGVLRQAETAGLQNRRGWWWRQQNWSGPRLIVFPLYVVWQLLLILWYLQLFLSLHPDVVHIQSRDDFIAATIAGWLLSKRIVWTDHADLKYIFMNHRKWYKNPVGKLVYGASKLAHALIIVSKSEVELLEQSLGHKLDQRYKLIYNGVIDEPVIPKIRPVSLKDDLLFCSTSRLVTNKGIGELIQAFKTAKLATPKIHLWLIGDGPEVKEFKLLADSVQGIEFVGYSYEALTYVAAADVFVQPSYNEAFSLSLVEAAMLGKPVIATRVGGNPEIIFDQETGILVTAKNVPELYEAMQYAIKNPEVMKGYGKNLRKLYERSFQFDQIVKDQIIPLYNGK